jgi:type IV pilus assembly protein PilV
MCHRTLPAPAGRQQGFSLIEVLVSMFIVSLGILALSGLMQASSRYGKTSELRSTATLLANDIADHVRANPGAAHLPGVQLGYNIPDPYTSSPSLTPPTKPTCVTGAECSDDELAAVDLYAFRTRLKAMLPGGSAYMVSNAPSAATNAKGSVDVWVAWTDPMPGNERPATECAAGMKVDGNNAVRCVYLQVGL